MQINEKAYAKINLFLDVVGKAPDGYHEIVSVMHSVSLCDEVSLSVERASYSCITLSVRGEDVPNDERNLAYIAAEAFLEKTGIAATVDITLEKQIPTKAGLGGGSSDAAAVLRALNLALGSPLTTAELCELGAEIGADVPFCIVGGTRLCRGRGEKMSAYPMDDLTLVIVPPLSEGVETPRAYRMLDEAFDDFKNESSALHEALFDFFVEDPVDGMYNVFESVVLPNAPAVDEARTALLGAGAAGAMMTGSGSAVFGIFQSKEEAESAAKELPGAIVARSIGSLL